MIFQRLLLRISLFSCSLRRQKNNSLDVICGGLIPIYVNFMHLLKLIGSTSETYSSQLTQRLSLSFKPLFKAKKQLRTLHWKPQVLNIENSVQPTAALQLIPAAGSELMAAATSPCKPVNVDFKTQVPGSNSQPGTFHAWYSRAQGCVHLNTIAIPLASENQAWK